MKATVVLEVEVYDENYNNMHGTDAVSPVTEDVLSQFIEDELGWAFASFAAVNFKSKTITDNTVKDQNG